MNIPANRVVAIATPLIFAPLAGTITALAAKHAPGVEIDQGQLQAIFIAGATIAVAKAGLWMRGWSKWESSQEALPSDALEPANAMSGVTTGAEPDLDEDLETDAETDVEPDMAPEDPSDEDENEDADDDPDDLIAELESALAETDDAATAGKL